ncbi:histone-lysine N-methyltransferase EHMT2-like [Hyposmocoma kahamanoa]|uniref:histone-lysine N-methyltransferase EHMT2-like n=1 Tax=Hyposmocoma kahamanoa TaxID=1477025 RepID=UPI000E6D8529|nr:histone-lysine N-methyltransferase EHMT2-like [Hyposmocoma kahamanoa]
MTDTDVENSAGELPVEVCTEQCQSAISLNMQMALRANGGRGRQRLLCSDISRGREPHPLPCVNEVDDTPLPDDFTYITAHVTPQPIAIDCTTQSLQGCSCTSGDCTSGNCECVVLGVRRWWVRDRLKPGFPYHDPPMLFDCNQTCGCDARKCKNTIISPLCVRGSLFIRAQVFRCGGARGWGLRAMAAAPRGTPVATYCGELLSMADADSRTMDQYMFALDVKPDLLEQCSEKTLLCVDAGRWGGAARFINHSCRPNLAPVRVFTNTRDLRLPTVTLFAARDIRIGDELTFDYGEKFWSVKSKWMKCECGTPDCRYTEQQTES